MLKWTIMRVVVWHSEQKFMYFCIIKVTFYCLQTIHRCSDRPCCNMIMFLPKQTHYWGKARTFSTCSTTATICCPDVQTTEHPFSIASQCIVVMVIQGNLIAIDEDNAHVLFRKTALIVNCRICRANSYILQITHTTVSHYRR